MKYLIRVEHPHEWTQSFSFHVATYGEAEIKASELAKGRPGYPGYIQISIYEFVKRVN